MERQISALLNPEWDEDGDEDADPGSEAGGLSVRARPGARGVGSLSAWRPLDGPLLSGAVEKWAGGGKGEGSRRQLYEGGGRGKGSRGEEQGRGAGRPRFDRCEHAKAASTEAAGGRAPCARRRIPAVLPFGIEASCRIPAFLPFGI